MTVIVLLLAAVPVVLYLHDVGRRPDRLDETVLRTLRKNVERR